MTPWLNVRSLYAAGLLVLLGGIGIGVPHLPSVAGSRALMPRAYAMPTVDPAGWTRVFSDDFSGNRLDLNRWFAYGGQPGGDPGGWWSPSHAVVRNGSLVLLGFKDTSFGGRWVTGGVSTAHGFNQKYGKYLVRFRMDSGAGIAHTVLLWPSDNSWPPEIDFSEDNGAGLRTSTLATLHYTAAGSQVMVHRQHAVDLTHWHTLGVEWIPGQLTYTLDSKVWATVTDSHVPSVSMALAIQTQAWSCHTNPWENCPTATTPTNVNLYVDWVVAYRRAS